MTDRLTDDFYALFEIPVEVLALSPSTLKTLKWHGRTSVGDCLLFYVDESRGSMFSLTLRALMYGEVFQCLVAGDHWHTLEQAGMWQRFERTERFGRPSIVRLQGTEQDLYEVSMDVLNLSIRPYNRLKRVGMISLGDCFNFYWHIRLGSTIGSIRFSEADYEELEARLMDLDCWDFIAEQYDD